MLATPQVKRYPATCRSGEMAATLVLGTSALGRVGSSPTFGTSVKAVIVENT